MKKLWLYTLTLLSLLLVGCNNGDDGLLDTPSGETLHAESLVVTPKNASVPVGLTQQMRAEAILSNSEVVDVTQNDALTWRSSDSSIATVDANGLVEGVASGSVTVTVEGVNSEGITLEDTATVTVTNEIVTSLAITPKTKALAKGLTQTYKAEALMSDGGVIDVTTHAALTWSSSDATVASISNTSGDKGVAKGLTEGSTTIKAEGTINGVTFSDAATLTVTDATISELVVTPADASVAVGLERAFKADAILTDGSTQDVTEDATWTTSAPGTALVSNDTGTKGVAEGQGVSTEPAVITASVTVNGMDYSASGHLTVTDAVVTALTITPKTAQIANGLSQTYTAQVTLSNGEVQDVTEHADVSWTTSDSNIASISNSAGTKGVATGEAVGTVTITATGIVAGETYQDTAELSVTSARVSTIQVTPSTESTPIGLTKSFKATAFLSDGTSVDITDFPLVSWSSSDSNIATITTNEKDGNGIATGLSEGSVTIKASVTANGQTLEETSELTVTAAQVASLVITPKNDTVPKGLTKAFTATVTLTDGQTTIDVTNDPAISWSSSDTNVATIETSNTAGGNGVATGVDTGTVTITATGNVNGTVFTDTAELTVTNAVITDLQVAPSPVTVVKGLTQQLTATATFSDSTSSDISSSVTWTPIDTAIATVSSTGLLLGVEVGSTTLTATKDGVTSNVVDVNVCNLAGPCIDLFDTGSGKLFTNSPSVAYLDSIDGSATDGVRTESGDEGPVGDFYTFAPDSGNTLTLCDTYNTNNLGGRTNWRLATEDELQTELVGTYGNMFIARGWPVSVSYYSSTNDPNSGGGAFYFVSLKYPSDGDNSSGIGIPRYASCVSNPES